MRAALWLMPEASAQARLDAAIAHYARAHDRPPFPAHITLIAGADPARLTEDAAHLFALRSQPLTLTRDGTLQTQIFTRTYALRFIAPDALLQLHEDAATLAGAARDAAFVAHISLTYGPPTNIAALDAIDDAFAAPVCFDAIVRNTYPRPFQDQSDVAGLQCGPRLPLAASPSTAQ